MDKNLTGFNKYDSKNNVSNYNLDHLYCHTGDNNYISSNSTNDLITILKENKQLKAIHLLHLDLIQEQSDQLLIKEKQVTSLKQENELLRSRLDRMERRIHVKQTRREDEFPNAQTNYETIEGKKRKFDQTKTNDNGINSFKVQTQNVNRNCQSSEPLADVIIQKREKSPVTIKQFDKFQNIRNESVIGENNGKLINKIVLHRIHDTKNDKLTIKQEKCDLIADVKVEEIEMNFNQGTSINDKAEIKNETKNDSVNMPLEEKHSKVPDSNDTVKNIQPQQEIKINNKDNIMKDDKTENCYTNKSNRKRKSSESSDKSSKSKKRDYHITTNKMYITRGWQINNQLLDNSQIDKNEPDFLKSKDINLEVPSWRIVNDDDQSYDENTANIVLDDLSEEAFLKRHAKFETDERRRKKWDVQRIREQRKIERLKKRHCKMELANNTKKEITKKHFASFYPSPDSIKFIQITDKLPVQAFGELIPLLKSSDFHLPWISSSGSLSSSTSQQHQQQNLYTVPSSGKSSITVYKSSRFPVSLFNYNKTKVK